MNDPTKHPLDCTDIRTLLSALLDDQLDADVRYRAERHLAGCEACRRLIGEAELNDAMIAFDAGSAGHGDADAVPAGFADAVLAKTAVMRRTKAARRWSALGWLAAAAALVVAVTPRVVDRRLPDPDEPGPRLIRATWELPPLALGAPAHLVPLESALPDAPVEPVAPPPARAFATAPLPTAGDLPAFSRDNAEAIDSATMLLSKLLDADESSFADVDFVRRTAEYDGLLPRLAAARRELPPRDQSAVLAAESVLFRIVAGPLSQQDVRELRLTIGRLDLPGQMQSMTRRLPETSSL